MKISKDEIIIASSSLLFIIVPKHNLIHSYIQSPKPILKILTFKYSKKLV